MKRIFVFCIFLGVLSVNVFADDFNALVIGVVDGDTIKVLKADKTVVRIRLENIDAPEMGQAFGSKAKQFLSSLIYKHSVYVSVSAIDRYQRSIASIYLDNININKEMVKYGYAWAYRYFLNDDDYILLEDDARKYRRGLWVDNNPIEPYVFRKSKSKR